MKALPSIAFNEFKGTAGDVTARKTGGRTVLNGRAQHSHITGHNLFVSAYHGFAILGNEHVPEPVPFVRFPMFDIKVIEARRENGCVVLCCRLWLSGADDCSRYRVLGKVLLTNPGSGCKTSILRNCLSVPTAEPGVVEFHIPSDRIGECQLHLRYLLIDSTSGYRTCHRKLSRLIAIL